MKQKALGLLERPIALLPQLQQRVWGGERISRLFGRSRESEAVVGESWEIHGASLVAQGLFQGRTLDSVVQEHGVKLLGTRGASETSFPLLTKWLDCRDWLSVQVHPDDALAKELTGCPTARGKSEAWYVAQAQPESTLIHGFIPEVNSKAIETEGEKILPYLRRLSPQIGSLLFTPAGTPHALGPGYLIYEVQQSSDITYRFFDWGRGRTLHPSEARQCLQRAATEPFQEHRDGLSCRFFSIERIKHSQSFKVDETSFVIVAAVKGEWRLEGEFESVLLHYGDSLLLPANLGQVRVIGEGELLKICLEETNS